MVMLFGFHDGAAGCSVKLKSTLVSTGSVWPESKEVLGKQG